MTPGAGDAPPASVTADAGHGVPDAVRFALPLVTRDLLLLVDGRGHALWCNAAFAATAGLAADRVAGRDLAALLPVRAAHRAALRGAADRLAQGHDFPPFEVELQTRDGAAARWLRIASQRLRVAAGPGDGGAWQVRVLCTLADVSEVKRLEAEALRLAELLDMAQEFGRIGVWERSLPSGDGHWDRHVYGFFGLDPAQDTPSPEAAAAMLHADDQPRMGNPVALAIPGTHSSRYRVVRSDGSVCHLHSIWEVQARPGQLPHRAVGVMVDDSETWELARSVDQANARLELALNLGGISIWRHDLRTGRVTCSPGGWKAVGLTPPPEGLSVEETLALLHPDDRAAVEATAQVALATRKPVDLRTRYRAANGRWRHLLARRVVETDAAGEPAAFLGVALDVTESVEQSRRALDLGRQLELGASIAGIGVWSVDTASGRIEWNAQMYEIYGRPPEAGPPTMQEWFRNELHPDDRPRAKEALRRWFESGEVSVEFEFRLVRPGGEVHWAVTRFGIEAHPGGHRLVGITVDRTEHKQAEAALHEANERAALATRSAGIGTWEVDLVARSARWDAQMYLLRGLSPDRPQPDAAERQSFVHPDDRALTLDGRPPVSRGLESYEYRVVWPDGSVHWLASRSFAVTDRAGRVLRRIGVNWDVTQAKLAEAERHDREMAERENRAKSKFFARLSHELRTPLNAVLGFTQLLQADRALSGPQRGKLDLIAAAGRHLLALINDALDLSNLQSGEMKLGIEPVPLGELVAETLPLLVPLAERHRVTLQADAPGGTALADPVRLRQVLINLVGNGIKYNRPGGRVMVGTEGRDGRVVLHVADSGRGLSDAQREHLFEPFNRLGTEREGIEGTGMGLVIVKALVEHMDGSIAVASRPGEGTTFSIDLPAAEPAPAPAPPSATDTLAPAGNADAPPQGRLLYIEDNPVNRLLVEGMIAHRPGLELHTAETGTEGVERAIELLPDLLLIDIQLPDFDGFEVLRRLRADARTRHLRCIALSANALPDDLARARAAGFDDYWTKPIRFDRFLADLDALFAPSGPDAPPADGEGRDAGRTVSDRP